MSTVDSTTPYRQQVATLPPSSERQAVSLATELLALELVHDDDGRPTPQGKLVNDRELRDLLDGILRPLEIRRLQRLIILEMVGRGIPLREVSRRLGISRSALARNMSGILGDGIGNDRIVKMREVEGIRLDRLWLQAQERFKQTGDASYLAVCNNISVNRQKLFGLQRPVPQEVKETKQVSVQLRVVESREQWEQIQAERAALEAATADVLSAEFQEGTPPDAQS